ncbi:hypothetical protein FRC10_000294 [Ceratobasidium sp. 414]|nr:hypothetical protein FRC10_000294 [Ceratobasidium sp. 414]
MISDVKSSTILATGALLLANTSGAMARQCYYDRYEPVKDEKSTQQPHPYSADTISIAALVGLPQPPGLGSASALARGRMVALPPPATSGSGPAQYEKEAQHQPGPYQPYPGGGAEYYPNQTGGTNYGSAGPQFPEPSHQPAGGYTSPPGPPPNTAYAPPAGPPPGK